MEAEAAQLPLVCASFWLALWRYGREGGVQRNRFALALIAGACASRAGWAWLHGGGASQLLAPGAGFSVLLLPIGLLALSREPASFRALCPALTLARLGCVAAGCCSGVGGAPLAAIEAGFFLALLAGLRRLPAALAAPGFLMAFGALRLAEAPWRMGGDTDVALPVAGVAFAWLLLGAGWGAGAAVTGASRPLVTERPRSRHAFVTAARRRFQTAGGG